MFARGAAPGFAAVGGALEEMAPYADTFRLLNGMFAVAWVPLMLGSALLARLLARRGASRPRTVCARRDLLSEGAVERILEVAGAVLTWPVDDVADAASLAGWGVGGLICDDLRVVQELVRNRWPGPHIDHGAPR